jgi:hypothetical protein
VLRQSASRPRDSAMRVAIATCALAAALVAPSAAEATSGKACGSTPDAVNVSVSILNSDAKPSCRGARKVTRRAVDCGGDCRFRIAGKLWRCARHNGIASTSGRDYVVCTRKGPGDAFRRVYFELRDRMLATTPADAAAHCKRHSLAGARQVEANTTCRAAAKVIRAWWNHGRYGCPFDGGCRFRVGGRRWACDADDISQSDFAVAETNCWKVGAYKPNERWVDFTAHEPLFS